MKKMQKVAAVCVESRECCVGIKRNWELELCTKTEEAKLKPMLEELNSTILL